MGLDFLNEEYDRNNFGNWFVVMHKVDLQVGWTREEVFVLLKNVTFPVLRFGK
jgi:hypothetical protein